MEDDFMTTKEKDYVNYILSKSIKQNKTDINYKHIFTNIDNKLEYIPPITESKTIFVFGKDTCRDNKRNRHFLNSENLPDSLLINLEIENLITALTLKKYYQVCDNTNIIIEIIEDNLILYLKYSKIWKLLDQIYKYLSEDHKKYIFKILIKEFENCGGFDECKEFINKWYDKIPKFAQNEIDNHFLTHFMINKVGLTFATCLLINNEDLSNVFYTNLIIRIELALSENEIWNFLAVLMKFSTKDKKFNIVKLTKSKLFEIKNEKEKIKHARNYCKCLGFEIEDLF